MNDTESSSVLYEPPLEDVVPCKESPGRVEVGAPCPDCGHAWILHPGVANPALNACMICEMRAATVSMLRPGQERPSAAKPDVTGARPSLVDFLLARIEEDEAEARADLETGYQPPPWGREDKPEYDPEFFDPPTEWTRKRVARILAECGAKRLIVSYYTTAIEEGVDRWTRAAYFDAIEALALPYAKHADYRKEWKPWS